MKKSLRLLSYARRYWPHLIGSVILMAIAGGAQGLMAMLIKPIFDRVLIQPGQPLVERETVMAAMPKGGPSCGTAGVDLTAQVFLLGADQLVHAVQGTGALTVVASPCPAPTRRGPLG